LPQAHRTSRCRSCCIAEAAQRKLLRRSSAETALCAVDRARGAASPTRGAEAAHRDAAVQDGRRLHLAPGPTAYALQRQAHARNATAPAPSADHRGVALLHHAFVLRDHGAASLLHAIALRAGCTALLHHAFALRDHGAALLHPASASQARASALSAGGTAAPARSAWPQPSSQARQALSAAQTPWGATPRSWCAASRAGAIPARGNKGPYMKRYPSFGL
jgi:hypothetical protein